MKKFVLAAVVAAVAVPAAAAPGDTDTESGVARAQIVAPISVTHVAGAALDFGVIAVDPASGGSISVSTGGAVSEAGDAASLPGSTISADAFLVEGDVGRSFSFSTTGGSLSNGTGGTMNFTTEESATSGSIQAGGNLFTVGGTLTVGAGQATGSYTGSYTATATYN